MLAFERHLKRELYKHYRMLLFGRAKYTSCLWTGFHRGWKVAEPLLTVPCWKGLWGVKVCEGRNLLIRFEGICSTILTRFGSSKIWIYIIFLLVQSMNIDRNYEMGVVFLQQKILKVASLTHRFSSQPTTHGVQKSGLHRQVHSKNCGEHFKFLWLYLFSYPRKTCLSLKNIFLLDFASRYSRSPQKDFGSNSLIAATLHRFTTVNHGSWRTAPACFSLEEGGRVHEGLMKPYCIAWMLSFHFTKIYLLNSYSFHLGIYWFSTRL